MLDADRLKDFCDTLRIVAEPTRAAIIAELAQDRRSVTRLVELVGKPFQTVSAHLATLREAGLVKDDKDGRNSIYRLNDSKFVTSEGGLMLEFGWARLEIGQYPATLPFDPREEAPAVA